MKNHKKVVVVGGGVSGLTAAYYLNKADYEVHLFEEKNNLGGLVGTEKTPWGRVESAANGIINSLEVEEFFHDLNVPLVGVLPQARKRYIWNEGKVQRWPFSLSESISFIFQLLNHRRKDWQEVKPIRGESVGEWTKRCWGDVVLRKLVSPALLGIYASRAEELSAQLVVSPLLHLQKKGGKPQIRGTVAPPEGMGQLISALEKNLSQVGVNVYLGKKYNWEQWDGSNKVHVLATSCFQAAQLTKEKFPDLSLQLSSIPMVSLITATVFFPLEDAPLKGFGCLFAPHQGIRALGVLFPHCIFPDRSPCRSETWILGGTLYPEVCEWSKEQILELILTERKKIGGKSSFPLGEKVIIWRRAIPLYGLELEKMLSQIRLPEGLLLHGNYLGRMGIAHLIAGSKNLVSQLNR